MYRASTRCPVHVQTGDLPMKLPPSLAVLLVTLIAVPVFCSGGRAATNEFYRGRQIRIIVGADAGGGYDAYARLVADHLGDFMPGRPTFVVQNMPGVGSLIALNYIANVAPQDGTVVGAINPTAVTEQLFNPSKAKYDSATLNWLGSPIAITYVASVWRNAPVQRAQQLFDTELVVGSAGGASLTLPLLSNGVLGTKFKVIQGYKSSGAAMMAMEHGETQGNGGDALNNLKAVHADLLRDGKLRIIMSYSAKPNPELRGIPLAVDFAKTDRQRAALRLALSNQELGWPYVMAADVPKDRLGTVQAAFDAMMRDPAFLSDAAKRKLDILPVSGNAQKAIVTAILRTEPGVVELVRSITGGQ
jgi:hypothetical protein